MKDYFLMDCKNPFIHSDILLCKCIRRIRKGNYLDFSLHFFSFQSDFSFQSFCYLFPLAAVLISCLQFALAVWSRLHFWLTFYGRVQSYLFSSAYARIEAFRSINCLPKYKLTCLNFGSLYSGYRAIAVGFRSINAKV